MDDIFGNIFVQQGWQCPICKRVYSPSTAMCLYCGQHEITIKLNTKINEVTIDKSEIDSGFNQFTSNKDK